MNAKSASVFVVVLFVATAPVGRLQCHAAGPAGATAQTSSGLATVGLAYGMPAAADIDSTAPRGEAEIVTLRDGPHLFVDDYLIERSRHVTRRVIQAERFLPGPVVTSGEGHSNFQPWVTVLRDPTTGVFRMWYNAYNPNPSPDFSGPNEAYLESDDGITWPGPFRRIDSVELTFDASIIDDGPNCPNANERYKQMYQHVPTSGGGWESRVAFSPDGLNWTEYEGNPVFRNPFGDMNNTYWDPIRQRYGLVIRSYEKWAWTDAEGQAHDQQIRIYYHSTSSDYKHWSEPKLILAPDSGDPGVTEWYGIGGFMTRGDLIVGMLKVSRDDVVVHGAPEGAFGYGYTVLAWTRDGEHWQRDRHTDKFLDAEADPAAWDHSHAWIDTAVAVGDEVHLYYGGYKWGHKWERTVSRQLGLVKIKRDRYVAREAGSEGGRFRTPLVELDADRMTLNVDATGGQVKVQVVDRDGKPLPGFAFSDCAAITTDSLDAPVRWTRQLRALRGKPVRLEFVLKNARLFAFDLASDSSA